jgi:hypothetical protein
MGGRGLWCVVVAGPQGHLADGHLDDVTQAQVLKAAPGSARA